MRIRWFGAEPWNTVLCEEEYKVDTPVGTKCLECTKPIGVRDRGIVTECSPRIWGHWTLKHGDKLLSVCSYHLACFLAVVEGGHVEGTRIEERSHGAQTTLVQVINTSTPTFTQPIDDLGVDEHQDLEDAEPGKGWKR